MVVGGSEAVERVSAAIGCSGEDVPLDAAAAARRKASASGFSGGDPEVVMDEAGEKGGASGLSGMVTVMVMVVGGGCGSWVVGCLKTVLDIWYVYGKCVI